MASTPIFVGIDVAKAHLDVAVRPTGERWRVPNAPAGWDTLVARLRPLVPQRIVLEATGGYESAAAGALGGAALPVAVVNPRQVRAFARAVGRLAKTDALDAAALAHFAQAVQPPVRPLPTADAAALTALLARRRQLVQMRTAERQRAQRAHPSLRPGIRAHVAALQAQIAALDHALDAAVRASPLWRAQARLLRSVPGVGPVLTVTLLAQVPELGTLAHKPLAALLGVAPLNRDSGQRQGTRACWGGRGAVRAVLYLATLAALRANPRIRPYYQQLLAAGKAKMVAVVACMHKLLRILNALVRTQQPWQARPVAAA